MKALTVCVLGGTGFVGSHLCAELARRGHRLRIASRRRERSRKLLVLPGAQVIQADVHDVAQLHACVQGCDAVINLVGILNEKGRRGREFHSVHVELVQKLINACVQCNITRLLHMSALNASPDAPSHYLCSKGEAENHVHSAGGKVAVTSFRPSVIFGPEDDFLNRFASLLEWSPGIFSLPCPHARLAPVYVGDIAGVMADTLGDPAACGSRLDLCGPRQYTLRQLVSYTAAVCGLRRRVLGLPNWMSRLQAHLWGFVPGKPFTLDNYLSFQVDSICQGAGHCPTTLESVAPGYLRKHSDYDTFRSKHAG